MSNGTFDLNWGRALANRLDPLVKTAIHTVRADPTLIPIVPGNSRYERFVEIYRRVPGPPLGIVHENVPTVKISARFTIQQTDLGNEALISDWVSMQARQLALAEDTIILYGAAAGLNALNINDDDGTLNNQDGLFQQAPPQLPHHHSVDGSILWGIQSLRNRGQYGPYCVIVSPTLHTAAETPIPNSGISRIAPILPQLRKEGFRFSEALQGRSGVIFSVGGAAITLKITWDAHVECLNVDGDATFAVVQQFRLQINDQRATFALT